METVKEKLAKLISEFVEHIPHADGQTWEDACACFLLSNGVTIQQWIPVSERFPDIAGLPVLMIEINEYGQKNIVKGFTGYSCPVEFLTNETEYNHIWGGMESYALDAAAGAADPMA